MDCQPEESERIPVKMPLVFVQASVAASIMITLAVISMIGLEKICRSVPITMGAKVSINRMEMTVPKIPKHCTTKASVHCFIFPPPSRGVSAIKGGATRYSITILYIRATQSSRIYIICFRMP